MAFSGTRAAFEGFRLARAKPGVILIWAVFYAISTAIVLGLAVLVFGASMLSRLSLGADVVYGSPEELIPLLSSVGALFGTLVLGFTVIGAIQLAAVYRSVLRPEDRGFGYMKVSGDELRQFVLLILWSLLYAVVWVAPAAGLIYAHVLGYLDGPLAVVSWIIGGCVATFLTVLLSVRLSLAGPMTLAQRRLRFFGSWSVTRGKFWPLLGAYVLAFIFAIVLYMLTDALGNSILGAVGLSVHGLMNFDGDAPNFVMPSLGTAAIVGIVGYAVLQFLSWALQLAIVYAPQAAAYRDLTAERSPPEPETFAAPAPEPDPEPAPPAQASPESPPDPSASLAAPVAAAAVAGAGAAAVEAWDTPIPAPEPTGAAPAASAGGDAVQPVPPTAAEGADGPHEAVEPEPPHRSAYTPLPPPTLAPAPPAEGPPYAAPMPVDPLPAPSPIAEPAVEPATEPRAAEEPAESHATPDTASETGEPAPAEPSDPHKDH